MTNITRHPLLQQAYDVCQAIEQCGASVPLTHVVTKASTLLADLDRFIPELPSGPSMSFGTAIVALKAGGKVARAGWNGKGMWLVLVPGTPAAQLREGSPYHAALGLAECEVLPHIDMWTINAEGRRAMLPGWLASQSDMLADDWQLVA
ncbi:DUF2829 domain-containing protein [Pseudomonas corrugata]|uniref:DUF2829 domain-containing protein n=1 Tax=Pseudomonas corrugata TaxID=47879 RepID=UPI0022319328|nr:DUF2829 domain-containing protein [Pseudomonas corrugata]UZD96259.1 DUF2829 domain-containing protein [Pseudomonas corrugata]